MSVRERDVHHDGGSVPSPSQSMPKTHSFRAFPVFGQVRWAPAEWDTQRKELRDLVRML